jgi:hypothetical protein
MLTVWLIGVIPRDWIPVPARKLRRQVRRNEFTDLSKYGTFILGCTGWHNDSLLNLAVKEIAASQSVSHYKFSLLTVGR